MPSDANTSRREADLAKVKELQTEFRGCIAVKRTVGNPVTMVELEIKLRTARNARFPSETQESNIVQIELPARYPLAAPPVVTIKSPIYNPNVYSSGLVCLGELRDGWKATTNLAMVVKWVMQILTLDPIIVGHGTAANPEAGKWYAAEKRNNPSLFPTVRLDSLRVVVQPTIQWRSIK